MPRLEVAATILVAVEPRLPARRKDPTHANMVWRNCESPNIGGASAGRLEAALYGSQDGRRYIKRRRN